MPSPPRSRFRISSIALLAAVACIIGGLLAANRSIRQRQQEQVDLDAFEAAHLLELHVATQQGVLHEVAALASRHIPGAVEDSVLVTDVEALGRRGSDLALVAWGDSAHPHAHVWSAPESPALIVSFPPLSCPTPDTVTLATSQPDPAATGLWLAVAGHDGRRTCVVGFLPTRAISAHLNDRGSPRRSSLAIEHMGFQLDLMPPAPVRTPPGSLQSAASVTLGTGTWRIIMAHPDELDRPRAALILMALGALVALGLAVAFERRQARRTADRAMELEHLSAELIRANRSKSEFLASVSHELRTPLNAIVGFAELLKEGAYGALNARQAGPVERIEGSAAHLRRLVDQILDLARIAAGRMELSTESVDLRSFVIDIATEMESLINERGLTLSLAIGATLPRVQTDPSRLRQIVTNLMGNAIKFTTAPGSITVRARLVTCDTDAGPDAVTPGPGEWIVLQIVDSGVGIPMSDRERIFDEFEQVNAGARSDATERGTGLGLSISRRLARLLGGEITVESQVERGSAFSVWLPLEAKRAPSREPATRQPPTF